MRERNTFRLKRNDGGSSEEEESFIEQEFVFYHCSKSLDLTYDLNPDRSKTWCKLLPRCLLVIAEVIFYFLIVTALFFGVPL